MTDAGYYFTVPRPTVELDLAAADVARDLPAGGVFVAGCALPYDADCTLRVRGISGVIELDARVVFVDPMRGAGMQIYNFTADMKAAVLALATEPEPEPEPEHFSDSDSDSDSDSEPDAGPPPAAAAGTRTAPLTMHERIRGLTIVEQLKIARAGEPQERILLERMYGKSVWEALLHNPRLTAPEVTRLARLGTLPRVLLETIVNNGTWLQIPEVRRALLANGRLGVDQVMRVLRLLPKHELKLAATQTAYAHSVRDAAKRLIKD